MSEESSGDSGCGCLIVIILIVCLWCVCKRLDTIEKQLPAHYGATTMTDYAALSDAGLDATIAVRVMGWIVTSVNEWYRGNPIVIEYWDGPDRTTEKFERWTWKPTKNFNHCFAAQTALAAKGDDYLFSFVREIMALRKDATYPWLLTAPARTRCVAMLKAVDAVEQGESA